MAPLSPPLLRVQAAVPLGAPPLPLRAQVVVPLLQVQAAVPLLRVQEAVPLQAQAVVPLQAQAAVPLLLSLLLLPLLHCQ